MDTLNSCINIIKDKALEDPTMTAFALISVGIFLILSLSWNIIIWKDNRIDTDNI